MSAGVVSCGTVCIHAACIRGVEAQPVTVEVSFSGGIPGISLVGMAGAAVSEASVRIRCALRGAGYEFPRRSIIVNLAPADMRKTGSGLDLPIAVAILALSGQIPLKDLDSCLFVGELSLDGAVMPVSGDVAYAVLARESRLKLVTAPSMLPFPLGDVSCSHLRAIGSLRHGLDSCLQSGLEPSMAVTADLPALDFADVMGQELAKRALVIAAAGELGLMMVGPPGSGKTMLAERLTSILPPMNEVERQQALCIHSVAREDVDGLLAFRRPFRSPHHSISAAGLVGGGRPVRPGEISLAHGGVLFLDELAEFPSSVLQLLRQPLESGTVRIVRADGSYVFPAHFQLVVASNPCPCGYLGDREVQCSCQPSAISRYQAKLGGPLADRIDLRIDVCRPNPDVLVEGGLGADSKSMKESVEIGRAFRARRTKRSSGELSDGWNRCDGVEGAVSAYDLDGGGSDSLLAVARSSHLTGRGIIRLCRIARAIADIHECDKVGSEHILEAAMYRGRCSDAE